jgi:hypothetical protein
MALPQEITPLNPTMVDAIMRGNDMDWIPMDPDPERAFIKILWTGAETGRWAVLFRWLKGYSAPQHKHLSAAHTFILKGKLQIRDGILATGDYTYEQNGMIHGATTALEDTDYLFICDGPIVFFDENGFTSYLGWEELVRMQQAYDAKKRQRSAA